VEVWQGDFCSSCFVSSSPHYLHLFKKPKNYKNKKHQKKTAIMTAPYASASLYVGDLPNDVTEGMLFEIFNQVGPVASIRVCRDAVTRRSLGYAYVNYHNVVDAERALDTLNSSLIKGRPCRIMWSQRDPSLRKSGVGNIFIKNLDKAIDHKALYDTFSAFGNILSCKVVTDDTSSSKGYGFVHFETKEAAEKAIARVNGMMLNNQKVFVGPFVARKERLRNADGETKFTNIYVKNLDENVTLEQLKQMFYEHGPITNAAIMMDENGKSKGFGFVNFETAEAAKSAVDAINGKDINGKAVYVGRAQKKSEREAELKAKFEAMKQERLNKYQGVNLYVKNLEDGVDDEKLRAEFAPFGTITSCRIMKDDKAAQTNSKGFGFVCFSTPEEATRAVTEMNGKMMGNKPLYVALAQRKDVRKAQLEAQHAQRAKLRQNVPGGMGPIYPGGGAPVFYPPGGMAPPQPQGYVYPQQMMPRPGWRGPQNQYQMGGPHYVVNVGQRQPGSRGPRGGGPQQGNRRGGPRNNRPDQQQQQQQQQGGEPQVAAVPQPAPVALPDPSVAITSQVLAQYSPDQQRMIIGERLYPLIQKEQPELAGKITGMLLDSVYVDDLVPLLDNNAALNSKIHEALEVLKQHPSE
jgi:polyadenylate-binding protein